MNKNKKKDSEPAVSEELDKAPIVDGDNETAAFCRDEDPAAGVEMQVAHWFKKMSDAEVLDEDDKAFNAWLAEDEEHRALYEQLTRFWNNPYFELALKERKSVTATSAGRRASAGGRSGKPMLCLAFCAALAAGLLFAAFGGIERFAGPDQAQAVLYQTAVGEQSTIKLSDGSTVNLNTDAKLYVNFDNNIRKITLLHGEVYFDVVQDGRPFWVEGGTGLVRVMGTAFEVRVDAEQMLVSVERGRVAVSPQNDATLHLEVTPRLKLAVTDYHLGELEYQPLNTRVADWRDGWLEFNNQTLAEVIVELDKYYSGSISLGDQQLSDIPVKGKYNVQDIRKTIRNLAMVMQLNYSTSDTGDIVFFIPDNVKPEPEG